MHLAEIKAHAVEYAETFAPHLKGEFQEFIRWIEGKHPEPAPAAVVAEPVAAPVAVDPDGKLLDPAQI